MFEPKVGFIGMGARGIVLLENVLLPMENVKVVAICDKYMDRVEKAAEMIISANGNTPAKETDYKKVIHNPEVNTVIISTSWETHISIAIEAMEAGKAVGMEVGGAYNLEECWNLVHTQERTQAPFMMLENCCFGRREMMALNMVKKGIFGHIVHCSGGYHHDLRNEVAFGSENRHYRLRNYKNRNTENYPTHELGPIAKILNINNGNRLVSLTATASKSAGLHDYISRKKSDDEDLNNTQFMQGDIITTVIKCAHGETITLTLDTTLPRYYSRGFTVRGTKGMYEEATDSIFLDNDKDVEFDFKWLENKWGNAKTYEEEFDHPVWKDYLESGVRGSHDGMDWLEFVTFFDCLANDKPMPVDVYDAATWMAVSVLAEQSIASGSMPVAFPDFTNGKWLK